MKRKIFKKILTVVLSMVLLLQVVVCMPMTASAETGYSNSMTVDFANASPVGEWEHYFIPDTTLGSDMLWDYGVRAWAAPASGASRTNQGEYRDASGNLVACTGIADSVHDISLLTYVGRTYNNFELNASWVVNSPSNADMIIGFGKNDLAKFANHTDGGFVLMFDKDANVKMQSSTGTTDAVAAPASAAYGNTVNLKLVVNDDTAEVTINDEYVNTFLLPEVYSGLVSIGAGRSAGSIFTAYSITALAEDANTMVADMSQSNLTDSGDWTAYWAEDVLKSSRIFPSLYADLWGWRYVPNAKAIIRTDRNEGMGEDRISYAIDTSIYNATYNVGLFGYNERTYEDFILDMAYDMSPAYTNKDAYALVCFGRDDPLQYATGKDGGFAIEISTSGNVAFRSAQGVTTLTTNAPANAGMNDYTNAFRLIVKDGIATVYNNGVRLASYELPADYDGMISFGATKANYCIFRRFAVTALDDDTSRDEYDAYFGDIFSNDDWTPYWVADASVDPNLTVDAPYRGWMQHAKYLLRTNQDKDANGNAFDNGRFSPTYNVAQYTYNAKKYQNCVIEFSYEFSQHSYWDSKVLLSFGRQDPTKYSTHEDGGVVLELGNISQTTLRSAKGAVDGDSYGSERDDTIVSFKIIINDWKATVIGDNKNYGTFDLPNDYDGYISLGANGAHYTNFRSFSVLALDNDVLGDMTGDDEINVLDLIKLKSAILDESVTTYSPADLDEDDNVGSTDLVLLKKFLFGTIDKF